MRPFGYQFEQTHKCRAAHDLEVDVSPMSFDKGKRESYCALDLLTAARVSARVCA